MKISDLFESSQIVGAFKDIEKMEDEIAKNEEDMEGIDSNSAFDGIPKEKYAKLEKDYQAYEAINTVFRNNIKAIQQPELMNNSIFLYDRSFDEFNGEVIKSALHAVIDGEHVEIKWIGSLFKGSGTKLIDKLKEIAKQRGVKKAKLTAKWNSSGFYDKIGFKKTSEPDPLSSVLGIEGDYEGDLTESKGYWHYTINDRKITIYFNPDLSRGKRWNWRDDVDENKFGQGYFTKRQAYDDAKKFAEQLSLQNIQN